MITRIRMWHAGRELRRLEQARREDEAVDAFLAVMRDSRHTGRQVPLRQLRRRSRA